MIGAVTLTIAAVALIYFMERSKKSTPPKLTRQIDQLLPQTQCGECGFNGCEPYAQAIAEGKAKLNLCPPGGEETVFALQQLLATRLKQDERLPAEHHPVLAVIREDECIGCTKCIKACPIDVIIGSAKQMHTILHDVCTGCGLCIPPCPVDCIDLIPTRKHAA